MTKCDSWFTIKRGQYSDRALGNHERKQDSGNARLCVQHLQVLSRGLEEVRTYWT